MSGYRLLSLRARACRFGSRSCAEQGRPSSKILAFGSNRNEAYKHGDVATTESPLADDFVITFEDGSTFSKSGHIAHNADSATRTAAGKSSQPTTVFRPRQQEGLSFRS